jgi:hypothetical protein
MHVTNATCERHALCSAVILTQDEYEQLQQAAAYICSPAGPFGPEQRTAAEKHALLAQLTFIQPAVKVHECLDTPGPLPFSIVRQVRCCILLYDCLAAALAVPGLCSSWVQAAGTSSTTERFTALLQGMQGSECIAY